MLTHNEAQQKASELIGIVAARKAAQKKEAELKASLKAYVEQTGAQVRGVSFAEETRTKLNRDVIPASILAAATVEYTVVKCHVDRF